MNRGMIIVCTVMACLALTWAFPLFQIVPLSQVAEAKSLAQFNGESFAKEFWTKQLIPAFDQATDATELVTAIKADPEQARHKYGRTVGIGRAYFYFFRGEGSVVSTDKSKVSVSCLDPSDDVDLNLKTSLLFGNTVRDSTGQLLAERFANSQDFNAISKELNRIVESEVQSDLIARAKVGTKIRFVACAEVRNSNNKILPLTAIPLKVEFPE